MCLHTNVHIYMINQSTGLINTLQYHLIHVISCVCYNKISSIMSAYCRVWFTIKAEKNISWFIVENKEDLLIYLRLKSLIFHNFFTFTAKLIKKNMLIFTYEIVKMRFNLETENLICAFPLLEIRTTTINRTGKQEKRLMKMPQGLKNRNLIFQK
jgi:hypothetical protein